MARASNILVIVLLAAGVAGASPAATASHQRLAKGFVSLETVAPTIRIRMAYATDRNFTGRPLPGYDAARCLLRREAAEALAKAQKAMEKIEMTLVVFDCYRPQRAVDAMNAFVRDGSNPVRSTDFPAIDRQDLVRLGYIAQKSMHSTGYAVDLAFAPQSIHRSAQPPPVPDEPCTGDKIRRGDRDLADFGTRFDCFDPKAATKAADVGPEARENRALLVGVMSEAGFENYLGEWWHFAYRQRQDARRFDVPIAPLPNTR